MTSADRSSEGTQKPLNKIPLALKMLVLTLTVCTALWFLLDYLQNSALRKSFLADLSAELEIQAHENRQQFDHYLQDFQRASKLIVNQQYFLDFVRAQALNRSTLKAPKHHYSIPPWMPSASILRNLVHAQHAIIIDTQGQAREVYHHQFSILKEETALPSELLHTSKLLRKLSHNQAYMTALDGIPYIISSQPFHDAQGKLLGTFILSSQIDNTFLMAVLQAQHHSGRLIALTEPNQGIVIASSNPDRLQEGAQLSTYKDQFLTIGKSFFDYGASDLKLQFTSLLATSVVEDQINRITSMNSQQRTIFALTLISCSTFLTLWFAWRIKQLTKNVIDFSQKVLNIKPENNHHGDELATLHHHFKQLSEEIISTRQDRDEELAKKLEAVADSQLKSQFLSVINHEIRTPMNAILGMAQLLNETNLDKSQCEYLETIDHAGWNLLAILDNILDFIQIKEDELELKHEAFNLEYTLLDIIKHMKTDAAKKELDLTLHISKGCPLHLVGDAGRIHKILTHLVSNAIKFTHTGHVIIEVDGQKIDDDYAQLNILVKDTGIGIKPNDQKRLYDPFTQADESSTRAYGGIGLGLGICKQLINLMNGKIQIVDTSDKGSTFRIDLTLPLA